MATGSFDEPDVTEEEDMVDSGKSRCLALSICVKIKTI